jgi:hypothetical protein
VPEAEIVFNLREKGKVMTDSPVLNKAAFVLMRKGGAFHAYRLEGSGYQILLPSDWFSGELPQEIWIEIRDRQMRFDEVTEASRA